MNKLKTQTSPYLLQHADNPVDWLPWGPEALQSARQRKKPILLSIGYSACHWCHVMAHESFENDETAALMNRYYINIKVDREERPDLDKIYQAAHYILTRNQGGWPLTMFLTPGDHIPFFGGTYFPPNASRGLAGFKDVLTRVATAYGKQKEEIREFKTQLKTALAQTIADDIRTVGELDPDLITRAGLQLGEDFDKTSGGFGKAPKFPQASCLELLLTMNTDTSRNTELPHTLRIVVRTLEEMARGGLYDHLGGGFYRYSVDRSWTIPHFEKMLYDNGALLLLYAKAWSATRTPFFRSIAESTADWTIREMQKPDGGFCSSLDADSEGEEGRFYVWTREEIRSITGPNYTTFAAQYGVDKAPNFEGRWHLRLPPGGDHDSTRDELSLTESIEVAKKALFEQRGKRVRPGLDDKILTAWNALMIKGLAKAGELLHRPDYIEAAEASARYIESVHWQDGRLLVTSKDSRAHLNAYLDDHAYLLDALLTLLEARWNIDTLSFAKTIADALLDRFEDRDRGGFFFTSHDHEELIQRSKSFTDEAMASGNAVAALALLKISYLVGEPRYHTAAESTLRAAIGGMARWPSAHASMMQALLEYTTPPRVAVLRGDGEILEPWLKHAEACGLRYYSIPKKAAGRSNDLCGRVAMAEHAVTAYICQGQTCSVPVTELERFQQLLKQ